MVSVATPEPIRISGTHSSTLVAALIASSLRPRPASCFAAEPTDSRPPMFRATFSEMDTICPAQKEAPFCLSWSFSVNACSVMPYFSAATAVPSAFASSIICLV